MKSRKLQEFIKEIQFVNRNPKDNSVLALLDDISTNPEIVIEQNNYLYRSRIVSDKNKLNKSAVFFGYGEKDSFIPPWDQAKDMRANYRYIPYLYCSNNKYLAATEVRPRLGAEISIAKIQILEKLVLLDFTMQQTPKKMSEVKQNLFRDLSELFSKPVTKDDDALDYIPTQYIAEYAKNLDYDGIVFRSSLHHESVSFTADGPPFNIVIFTYTKCLPIASNVYRIISNHMEFEQTDSASNREEIVTPINRVLDSLNGAESL